MSALIEWQEESRVARQLGGHRHFELIHRKVHQRPTAKTQQRLITPIGLGQAIFPILLLGILQRLLEAGFELQCCHWDAVQKEGKIDTAIIAMGAINQLGYDPEPIGLITSQQFRIQVMIRLEAGHLESMAAIFNLVTQ
ncbi:hypothetical protein D3C86_1782380 [compost metagenome]